jgi:NAD(P)-dependent dehydrogenase (short-subunit alcohol dehydrogenase family)
MQIQNSVFIITGGASGLGAATARMIVENGGKVVLADVQVEPGEKLAGELGGRFVKCDVTSEADAKTVVEAATALGALHGLVNCAGVAPAIKTVGKDGPHPLDVFQRVVNINLIGTFNMARLAADAMAKTEANEHGERGVIINTASVAAYDGQIGQAAYGASKAAVVGLTLPMARDLSRSGIRVMTIAPGIFETPMLLGMPQEVQEALGRMVPFPPRLGKASEYAQLAKAIIENVMLNGETIRLDGAIRMQPK